MAEPDQLALDASVALGSDAPGPCEAPGSGSVMGGSAWLSSWVVQWRAVGGHHPWNVGNT